jgi:hypothetical protein
MRRALNYIAEKKALLSELPFFAHLRDRTISPVERFAFVPAGAPFIMAFADLNKYTLHVAEPKDALQELINVHSEEDATHFKMYLKDLEILGFDVPAKFSDTLKFLWADERKHCRQTCYLLTAMLASASTTLRLVIVEAIEAGGSVAFKAFSELAGEYRVVTGKELVFFGPTHEKLETGHTIGTDDIEERLRSLVLSDEETVEARRLVDDVFEVLSAMMQELHVYVQKRQPGQWSPDREAR